MDGSESVASSNVKGETKRFSNPRVPSRVLNLAIPRFLFPGADFIVRCIGDSLEPKIHKGDFCVIRKMQEPLDGRAMLIKSENGVCMKVIKKIKDSVELCSTNPKYKPFTPKELTIIGLIIGHWSRDDREHWS